VWIHRRFSVVHDPCVHRSRPEDPVPPTPGLCWSGRKPRPIDSKDSAQNTRQPPRLSLDVTDLRGARDSGWGYVHVSSALTCCRLPCSRCFPPAPSSSFDYYHSLPWPIPTHIPSQQSPDPIQLPTLMSGDALYWKFDDRNSAFTYGPGWSNLTDINAHETTLSYTSKDTNVTIQFYGTPSLPALHAT